MKRRVLKLNEYFVFIQSVKVESNYCPQLFFPYEQSEIMEHIQPYTHVFKKITFYSQQHILPFLSTSSYFTRSQDYSARLLIFGLFLYSPC